MSQTKCWRCRNRMDQSFFDPGYKACKKCREHTIQYLLSNAVSIKEKQKQYYEAHKEHIKQYQEEHKEHIKAHKTEKINCPICNCTVSRSGLREHKRRSKCKNNITTQST